MFNVPSSLHVHTCIYNNNYVVDICGLYTSKCGWYSATCFI